MHNYPKNYAEFIFKKHADKSNRLSYVDNQNNLTFGQLANSSHAFAKKLSDNGVGAGDMVIVALPNTTKFPVAFLGCLIVGAVIVTVDPDSDRDHVVELTRKTLAKCIVASQSFHKIQEVPLFIDIDCDLNFTQQIPYHCYEPDDLVMLICTSATSGQSKLVKHRNRLFYDIVELVENSNFGITESSVMLCTSKISFGYPLSTIMIAALGKGSTAVMFDATISPVNIVNLINKHQVTHLFTVPSVCSLMYNKKNFTLPNCLEILVCAGESLPRDLEKSFENKYKIPIYNVYGFSEMPWIVIANDKKNSKLGSVGKSLPGLQLKILDSKGNICPSGTPGTLYIHTSKTSNGYYNSTNDQAFSNGWFKTDDIFYQDSDGFYFFVNRNVQFVKINSTWTSAQEIENLLWSTGKINDCTVIFDKTDKDQFEALAFVVIKDQVASKDIGRDLRADLARIAKSNQIPKKFYDLPCLPRSKRNKRVIDKKILVEAYHASRV